MQSLQETSKLRPLLFVPYATFCGASSQDTFSHSFGISHISPPPPTDFVFPSYWLEKSLFSMSKY